MKAVVKIKEGSKKHHEVHLDFVKKNSYIFGRSEGDFCFDDDLRMSRKHFSLDFENGVLSLRDLKSANKTWVNSMPVSLFVVDHKKTFEWIAGGTLFELKILEST